MPYYKTYPLCGAALDPGEICTDCRELRKEHDKCQSLETCQDAGLGDLKLSSKRIGRRAVGLDGDAVAFVVMK